MGQELQMSEQLLRDRGDGLHSLWGLLRSTADANSDTIAIAAHSATALAVNRSGELRAWSTMTQQLVSQVTLYDALDAVGALGQLAHNANRNSATATDKSVLLQG
jgi:hypothetical protein